MKLQISDREFRLLQAYIFDKSGIHIHEDKTYLIHTRFGSIMNELGISSYEELYLRTQRDPMLTDRLIDAITTNETLWFRDKHPWVVLKELLMPHYIQLLRSERRNKIRIWSAASSTGQEAYSTAMLIDYYLKQNKIKDIGLSSFEILATDISYSVIDKAQRAVYDPISIQRGLDQVYLDNYFEKSGSNWVLKDSIRSCVGFEQFNLQRSYFFLGKFDLIFCRYVLIYFSDVTRREIFEKMYTTLHTDGVLYIGASELYPMMDHYFDSETYKDGTYYIGKGWKQNVKKSTVS